jgi:hypothetical protein
MKKIVLVLTVFVFTFKLSSQVFPDNEIKLNIANVIAFASVEIGYEYLFEYSQSVDVELMINDRFNFYSESGSRKFNTSSLKVGYNYYFGTENPGSGLYFNPFLKYRFGDFEEEVPVEIAPGVTQVQKVETDMNSFIIGLGGGYKWNFSNSFVVSVYGSIGRNFSEEVQERFQAIEFHGGVGVGYRF